MHALRSSSVAVLVAGSMLAGAMATQCGGMTAPLLADAGGGDSVGGSSSGASGSGGNSSGGNGSSGISSSGNSSGTGSSSGAWGSCFPSDGTYYEHFMFISGSGPQCATPPDMTTQFPIDAGTLPPECAMVDNPCAVYCKFTTPDGDLERIDEQWTATATTMQGTVQLVQVAPDGGIVSDCAFSFTFTKQ
jgi:hypothetical protein